MKALGYRSIGLAYINPVPIGVYCGFLVDCQINARREQIEGIDYRWKKKKKNYIIYLSIFSKATK